MQKCQRSKHKPMKTKNYTFHQNSKLYGFDNLETERK